MTSHKKRNRAFMLFICAVSSLLSVPALATDPTMLGAQPLTALGERLEQKRGELHIPGMAVALVKGDEVLLLRGLGLADVERKEPVDVETTFPIGSCTKAFTATLIGMLVDEGKMAWDEPVMDYLPYLKLQVATPWNSTDVTIRDLLCHRTGFAFMDLLWLGEPVDRDEVLRTTTHAKPYAEFRKEFHYNSVMFSAAGVAAGKACSSTWETLVRQRLFDPLGMSGSSTSLRQTQADRSAARGYMWLEEHHLFVPFPSRSLESVGPAGAINANASDMAKWVRFLVARGTFGGRRLISKARLHDTWTPQVTIGEGEMYGLGWVLREMEGQPVVFHTGGLDGFTSLVALLPESNVGVVLLANVTNAPLLHIFHSTIWDAVVSPGYASQGAPSRANGKSANNVDATACSGVPQDAASGSVPVGREEELPTVEDLLVLRQVESRKNAIAKLGVFRLTGSIRLLHAGIQGGIVVHAAGHDRRSEETTLGKFGYLREVVNGNRGWAESSYYPFHALHGAYLDQQRREHPAAIWGDWRELFKHISVLRTDEIDGRRAYVVRLQGDGAPPWTAYIDTRSGDLLKVERDILLPVGLGTTHASVMFGNYRERQGLRIPFRITSTDGFSGTTVIDYDTLEINVQTPVDLFVMDRHK